MLYKLSLKNTNETVVISDEVYEIISKNPYLQSIKFLDNLRIHSHGYAFFQKNYPKIDGGYKNVTIYLHRYIAENFVEKPTNYKKRLLVSFKNGNRLDCRTSNIFWATSSEIVRNINATNSTTGFRGVSKANNKYRAAIFLGKTRYDLGNFDTAEEAARAYNQKSIEWFGQTKSLNKVDGEVLT